MRLLLDTHILVAIMDKSLEERFPMFVAVLHEGRAERFASVASLWEIAIKLRLQKLSLPVPLAEMAPLLEALGVTMLSISIRHVVEAALPEPPTRDPFDRLLLAQAQIEGMRLLTVDRALADHPVTFR
jgi:PIN domain nuclease of toxin-antitoxin system